MSKSINQEKCEKCRPNGFPSMGYCLMSGCSCPCHTLEEKECRHCADGSLCNQSWSKHKCECDCHPPTPKNESWEEEFFKKFGADKIWVVPSMENIETISEIKEFISQEITKAKEEAYDRGWQNRLEIDNLHLKRHEETRQETLKKLRQKIEGMKKEVKNYWDADALYNQALDNILKILEE